MNWAKVSVFVGIFAKHSHCLYEAQGIRLLVPLFPDT